MADPKVTAVGLFDEENEDDTRYSEEAAMAVREKLENMPKREGNSDYPVEEAARIAARRYFEAQFSKKPQTRVHLVRI
jgi:ribonuclease J